MASRPDQGAPRRMSDRRSGDGTGQHRHRSTSCGEQA